MTTVPPNGGYFLFDGALMHGTPEQSWLNEQPQAIHLYDDLGEEAAKVGPVLLPAVQAVGDFAQSLAISNSALQFAGNRLICHQPVGHLKEHLRRLRYLLAGDAQRYYFRYADSRALAAVWFALTPLQQASTLGPITSWEYINRDGGLICITASNSRPDHSPPTPPLTLQPAQWHAVLEAGRVGELLDDTVAMAPPTALVHSPARRFAWTRKTYHWLRKIGIADTALHREANLVVWLTEGLMLNESLFEYALRDAQESGDLRQVRAFGNVAPRRHA